MSTRWTTQCGALLLAAGLLGGWGFLGCSGGGGGGTADRNDNVATNDNGGSDTSAGAAAFAANGCSACHTPENNNFSDSSVDDIVDTLLGDKAHPGGEFGDLTDQEIDDITDFLVAVMTGDDDLDDGEDNSNGNANDNQGGHTDAATWFETVWNDFDQHYSHFETKNVDWGALRTQYAPQFDGDLSTDEFLTRLAALLAELRDLHVWLFDANGEIVDVYARPATQNYPDDYPAAYFPQGIQQLQSYPLWHGWLADNVAYISVESFETERWDGLRSGEIDTLFATYAGADALVIDARRNNGGNETVATTLAGHLTDAAYVYGYHRTRNAGTDHADFGAFEEHRLEPAANERFLKPVACLIGERNMSSAEWFVLMMRENPQGITLIGDTTRGSSGNPQEFGLDNGIKYYIPSWEAYRADQTTKIEDVGVPPTTGYALDPEESYTGAQDRVLERAVELLTQ
jgi:carboxyl-terminal processing protease